MVNAFQHHIKVIEECYHKQGRTFVLWEKDILKESIEYIDEDYEPNSFGLDVEDTIGWLLELGYELE